MEDNIRFVKLTSIYIGLNKQLLQAVRDHAPSDVIEVLKEQIKTVVDQIAIIKKPRR